VRGQEKKREGLSGERLVKYLRSINKGYCKKIEHKDRGNGIERYIFY
jgi:hypothetical protein